MTPQEELELLELEREAAMRSQPPVRRDLSMQGTAQQMGRDSTFKEKLDMGLGSAATRIMHGIGLGGPNAAKDREILDTMVGEAGPVAKGTQFVSEVGLTALPAAKAAQGVARGAAAVRAIPQFLKRAAGSLPGMAAVEGAVGGAVLSPEDRLQGAAVGGALGPVAQKAGQAVGNLIAKPVPQTAAAEALTKRGIDVTPGQGADRGTLRGRLFGATESAVAETPGFGFGAAKARDTAQNQYRIDALRLGTSKPGNVRPDKTVLSNVEDIIRPDIDNSYRAVLKGHTLPQRDPKLYKDISKTLNDPAYAGLTPAEMTSAKNFIKANLLDRIKPGMTAQELFEHQTTLRREGYKKGNEKLKDLYLKAADDVYTSIDRQLPGSKEVLDQLKGVRMNFGALDKTMKGTGGTGEFKPSTLRRATKNMPGDMQTMARRGEEVFGNRDPLVHKVLTMAGLLGGTGYAALEGSPGALALPAAAALLSGRKSGSNILKGNTALQRKLAVELARGKPAMSGALGAQASQFFTNDEEEQ